MAAMSPFLFVILLATIVAGTIIILVTILSGKGSSKIKKGESKELEDLYKRCEKLTARIESLETIIIKHERNSKSTTHDKS